MPDLDAIAARHGFPPDAARHVLDALAPSGGRMAQFSHPALGGMGQWHAGGMTMIGAMSDDALKARVAALCRDLVALVPEAGTASRPDGSWPEELGSPSSSGSQDGARYGVFPSANRLVVIADGRTTVYDTGGHVLGGVSQQQGSGRDLRFVGQNGPVHLHELREVGSEALPGHARAAEPPTGAPAASGDDHVGTLERLAELHEKGILTDDEFRAKKAEILARL